MLVSVWSKFFQFNKSYRSWECVQKLGICAYFQNALHCRDKNDSFGLFKQGASQIPEAWSNVATFRHFLSKYPNFWYVGLKMALSNDSKRILNSGHFLANFGHFFVIFGHFSRFDLSKCINKLAIQSVQRYFY